jgi:hypothetical protein
MSIRTGLRAALPLQTALAPIALLLVWTAEPRLTRPLPLPQTQDLTGETVDEKGEPISGAVCTLTATRNGGLPEEGLSATTGDRGQFHFSGLVPGSYNLDCAAVGHMPAARDSLEAAEGRTPFVQVVLPLETALRQKVEVRSQAEGISPQTPSRPATLSSRQLQTLPLVQQKFKAALPLVPGVVRTPDGKINIKGTGESQGLLLVDSAETVDPVTGSFAIDVPIDAVESVAVYKAAYRAEFGRFSGGLTSIETKPPTGQFHFEVNDVVPTPRIKSGHIVGVADDSPRLNVTGPMLLNRLNFSESITYELSKQPVRGLPWPRNETRTEGVNSFASFQYIFSPQHLLTVNLKAFPLRQEFADINSLIPQSASSNYRQRGYSVGATDRRLLGSGGALTTLVQDTRFDSNAYGQGSLDMLVTPDGWAGNFFNRYNRTSSQQELLETYQFPNRAWLGKHEVKVGADFVRRAYTGSSQSHPVRLLRSDGSMAERIDFTGPGALSVADSEGAAFAQDHWVFNDRLALDMGLRLSGQTVGEPAAVAPRAGLAYTPDGDGKTIFRGGVGIFYDRVPLLAGDFTENPTRVVSLFDSQGALLGPPLVFRNAYIKVDEQGHRIVPSGNRLDSTPHNVTWNLEADREIRPRLVVRLNYLSSRTYNVFIVDPRDLPEPVLLLSNTGNARYHELESTLHFRASANADLNFSYVHSLGRGDLNTLGQTFVPFEQPIIRPNVFADLPSNVPNRVVAWGQFKVPWQITASPILDVHTGFPYSAVDVLQNYAGPPNGLRFPYFLSLDLKVAKDFRLPFVPWLKNHKFRGALGVYNLTNHANPRDVFSSVASPFFGHFLGFQHRSFETWLDLAY